VLTPRSYNRLTRLCVVCPITSRVKGYPLESPVPPGGDTIGAVLCDHVRSVDWEHRGATFVEKAPPGLLVDVQAKIKSLLGIP
jgi:mRNA interferase MazF